MQTLLSHLKSSRKPFLTMLGFAFVSPLAVAQDALVLSPVAKVGATAPGTASTWTAVSPDFAAVGIDGGVSFTATAGGLSGLWFGDPDALSLAARAGDAAPGTGTFFSTFTRDSLMPYNGFGSSFLGLLQDGTDSIWTVVPTPTFSLIAREGQVAPGSGTTYTILNRAYFNNDGDVLYPASLAAGSGGTRSLWRALSGGAPAYIARSTEAMAAVPGSTYSLMGAEMSMNDNATACFPAIISGGPVTAANDEVLLAIQDPVPLAPTVIAREGDVAPGTVTPGLTFLAFTACHINDDEDVLFRGTLNLPAPVSENIGVWLYDSGTTTVSPVAIEGGAVPGVAGAFFENFEELFLGDGGVIAIVATARDTADGTGSLIGRGVWIDAGAGLELVALVGQSALDKDGVTAYGTVTDIYQVTMNVGGDLALEMRANVSGSLVKGVWVREAVAAAATRRLISVNDKTYDTQRQVSTVSSIELPKSETFTAFGGGPYSRQRPLGEDGVPLLWLDTSASRGLFFPTLDSLNVLVTSTNEEAPGAAVGTLFQSIRPAGSFSESGLVAVRGYLQDGTGDAVIGVNTQGIWAEELVGGVPQLTLVARTGDATPLGDTFGQFPVNPIYNLNGSIAFSAQLSTGGSVLCAGAPGALSELAKTGELVSLTGIPSGAVYDVVRSIFAYNDNGRVVTSCTLVRDELLGINAGNDSAILRLGALPRVIAREGASVGAGADGVFDHLLNRPVLINNVQRIAFLANRKRNVALGITVQNAGGVWYHNGSTLVRVAVGGTASNPQLAPEAGGAQYLRPTDVVFNDASRIGFRTILQGAGVTPGVNDVALYTSIAGATPVLLVRTGSTQLSGDGPAGIDPAATFSNIERPDSDASSKLVFRGQLTVGQGGVTLNDDEGVWANTGAGATTLLLREGGAAPDADGVATADVFDSFDDPAISLDGRVVVSATLRVGVGTIVAGNNRALFVQGSGGQFHRVVQEGQSLAIADGLGGTVNLPVQDVYYPNSSGGAAGFYKAINSEGFVMSYLTFVGGASATMIFLVP